MTDASTTDTTDTATRLLLAEDLLLLLARDDTGHIRGEGRLHIILPGAVLVELASRGLARIDDRDRVRIVPGSPTGDAVLDDALARIDEKPRRVASTLAVIGSTDLRTTLIRRLLDRGLLAEERGRLLGFIPTTRMPAQDLDYEREVLEGVRAVLVDGAEPDPRTGALAALLSASGTLPEFHPDIRWSGDVYERGKALERGEWGASAVGDAILMLTIALTASTAAIAAAAASSGANG